MTINLSNGDDAVLKVIFTVKIGTAQEKTKTLHPSETLELIMTKEISMEQITKMQIFLSTKADIFKVRAVSQLADNTECCTNYNIWKWVWW